MTEAEETALRSAIRSLSPEREPELDLALQTGMRRGEQYGLQWRDVDLIRGTITIRRSKNGEIRYIPLNSAARAALGLLKEQGDPVYACPDKHKRWFESAIKQAGIRDFRWHDLRHTFASRLVAAGVHIRAVQELLGHKTIQMTLRYSHVADTQLREGIEKIAPAPPPAPESAAANRNVIEFRGSGRR